MAAVGKRLSGPMGVLAAWEALCRCGESDLSGEEIWIYGCELLRDLERIHFPEGPDQASKTRMVEVVTEKLRKDLAQRTPKEARHGWLKTVRNFYLPGSAHAQA